MLASDKGYVVLVPLVDPEVARTLREKYPEIAEEKRESRQYPGGALAANVVGAASWNATDRKLTGLMGLESSQDNLLAGQDGLRVVDTAEGSSAVIPGSTRFERPATPGSDLQLTLDSDLQYTVQRQLAEYAGAKGAKGGSAVVLDAATGEVLAMANARTFDPRGVRRRGRVDARQRRGVQPVRAGLGEQGRHDGGGPGVRHRDPGAGVRRPRQHPRGRPHRQRRLEPRHRGLHADRASSRSRRTSARSWRRARSGRTASRTCSPASGWAGAPASGCRARAPGGVPSRETWSGSTFGNLPIGQGLSVTALQMAGMYQAVANDGLRVPPRIVEATIGPDGVRTPTPAPETVRVVSPETAAKLRTMLTAVTQDGGTQDSRGTGSAAAIPGYQVAGKTGTAQQVDPACGCYASSIYWITFAGMLPAQDPRYVVAIMLDAPQGGTSAAPLFHEIGSYLAQREKLPVSAGAAAGADARDARTPRQPCRPRPAPRLRAAAAPAGDPAREPAAPLRLPRTRRRAPRPASTAYRDAAFAYASAQNSRRVWGGGRARSWAPVAFRRAARPHLRRRRGCPAAPASGFATRGPARPRGRRRRRARRSGGRRRRGRRGDAAGRRGAARRPLRGAARRPRPRRRLRRRRRVAAGAVAVLTDPAGLRARRAPRGCPCWCTRSPARCSGRRPRTVYGDPTRRLRVLGVTGTSGKTTVAHLLEAGLAAAGRTTGLVGTVGVRVAGETLPSAFTTPEAPDLQALFAVMLEEGVTDVAMEVSSHALALGRVAGTRFAVGAFTNLSQDHLDFHADMDDYFAAKASLFAPGAPSAR